MAFSLEDGVLLVLLVGYAGWWAYDLRRGATGLRATFALHNLVYPQLAYNELMMGAYSLGLAHASLAASGLYELVGLPVVFILATASGYWFSRPRLTVEFAPDGRWRYRGAVAVPLIWLVLWGLRLGIEDGLLNGYSVFLPFGTGAAARAASVPPLTFDLGVGVIVLLYFVSFGVMTGLSIGAWAAYRRARRSAVRAGPSSAPPG